MEDGLEVITPEEAVLLPWFAMGDVPNGAKRIYLFLGDRMAKAPWDETGEEKVRAAISLPVVYFLVHNLGEGEYIYESGLASQNGMRPLVVAKVRLDYIKGEVTA